MLTEDPTVCGAVHREDVAELVVKALLSAAAANKVPSPRPIASARELRPKYQPNTVLSRC